MKIQTYFDHLSMHEQIFLISALIGALCFLFCAVLFVLLSTIQKKKNVGINEPSLPSVVAHRNLPWLRWRFVQRAFGCWMIFGVAGLALSRWLNAGWEASLLGAIIVSGLTLWTDIAIGKAQTESQS